MDNAEDPNTVMEKEIVQTIPTADGGLIKVTHYVKDIKKNDDARVLNREERQIQEHEEDGVKVISDIKLEMQEDDGIKTKKLTTTTTSVKKSGYGSGNVAASAKLIAELSPERFPKFIPIESTNEILGTEFVKILSTSPGKSVDKISSSKKALLKNNDYFEQFMPSRSSIISAYEESIAPTFAFELENLTIKKGEAAYFEGIVNGTPPFEIIWFLGENVIELDNGRYETMFREESFYLKTKNSYITDYKISLKINKSFSNDQGKYTLQVKNLAGEAFSFAKLIVEGKNFKN
jgi:hypothetical protein